MQSVTTNVELSNYKKLYYILIYMAPVSGAAGFAPRGENGWRRHAAGI